MKKVTTNMKIKNIFISIAVFLYLFFDVPSIDAKVIISEFSIGKYIGTTNTNGDDFIELYNTGSKCIPLKGWKLRKRIQSGTESSLYSSFKNGDSIMPGDFFLWVSGGAKAEYQKLANAISSGTLTKNGSIAILNSDNSIEDSIIFGDGHINPFSSSTILLNPGDGLSNERSISSLEWKSGSIIPTPTGSTSIVNNDLDGDGCPDPPPMIYNSDIRINEILANPSGSESTDEFIELYNISDTPIDLSLWSIKDNSVSGKYIFQGGTTIKPKGFLVVYRKTFTFALNNSNETVSLLDPNGNVKDTVSYRTAKEDVSYNYTETGFRGGTPTPGALNETNNLPQTKENIPRKGYHGVAIDFSAQGKDSDNDVLKYTWDFGDGHKSYKEKTSHTYEKNGTYTVMLKTSDGKDDVEETFTIEIKSYPRLKIRITSFLPNPTGSDTDNEWIIIENREKKKINLKEYSIATGWKNLVNHPINEDFFIEAKKEAKLTRTSSLFTLPNQKGKIELRAPDGKVLQSIRYKLEKPVAENAVYEKEKGSAWKWTVPTGKNSQSSKKETAINEENVPLVLGTSIVQSEETLQQVEEVTPIKTKSDQISLDPTRPLPQDILAYGTQVRIPDTLTLAFLPSEETNTISVSASMPLSSEESILSKINASLNEFLNSVE